MQLNFRPSAFLAMGSPISFFMSIRRNADEAKNRESAQQDSVRKPLFGPFFSLPTCTNFFNLFHPHDPCAYRIEPVLQASLKEVPPALVPHHDGKLRINYKMKSLQTKISDAFGKLINPKEWFTESLDNSVKKIVENDDDDHIMRQNSFPHDCPVIQLNDGKRVDYILQETPFEGSNEYLSGLTGAHTSYFDLPDVARFIIVYVVQSSSTAR